MGAPRFNVHQQVSESDQATLQHVANEVSRRFFGSSINLAVQWGIPSASEAGEPKIVLEPLANEMREKLATGVECFIRKDFENARLHLEPLVQSNHVEATKLYINALQKLRDPNWKTIAASLNRVSTDTLYVPASSTEVRDDEKVILIHQGLSMSVGHGAPKCVLGYSVHHEMLHVHLETDPNNPHPPLFRRFDSCYPDRKRSIHWLQKFMFTTLEDGLK